MDRRRAGAGHPGVNSCAEPPAVTPGSAASCWRSQPTSPRCVALTKADHVAVSPTPLSSCETASSRAWLTETSRAAS